MMKNNNNNNISIVEVQSCKDKLSSLQPRVIDFVFIINNINISFKEGFLIMQNWLIDKGFNIFYINVKTLTVRAKFPENNFDNKFEKDYYNIIADFTFAIKEIYCKYSDKIILKNGSLIDHLEIITR